MDSRVGFWPRLGAYVLDVVLMMGLTLATSGTIAGRFPAAVAAHIAEITARAGAEQPGSVGLYALMAQFAVGTAFIAPIYALIEGLVGWSPGKLALGLRIATLEGARASLPRLLGRFVMKGSGALLALAALVTGVKAIEPAAQALSLIMAVGCLLALGAARQALHDKLVLTTVLRKSDLAPAGPARPAALR